MPYYHASRYIEQEASPVRYNIHGSDSLAEILEAQAELWNVHPESLNRVVIGFGPHCGKQRPRNVVYIGVIEWAEPEMLVFREGVLTTVIRKAGMRKPQSYNLLPESLRRGEAARPERGETDG